MNEATTKTDAFFRDYTYAMQVDMKNPDGPSAVGLIVPRAKALNEDEPSIEGQRKIIQLQFGEHENSVTFYNPDGSVAFSDNGEKLPPDNVIHDALNEAWAGDADSSLMDRVRVATLQIVEHMLLAHNTSMATGVSAALLFHSMSKHDKSLPAQVYKTDENGNPIPNKAAAFDTQGEA